MKTQLNSQARRTNSVINRLYTGYIRTGNIIICELGFYFHVARDRPEFRVNVKECWILFVTRENAKYFFVTEFYKGGIGGPSYMRQSRYVI